MRLSEAITIYLAAGASFGAYDFIREQNPQRPFHSWMKAARAMILWPLAAVKMFQPQRHSSGPGRADTAWDSSQLPEKTNRACGKLLASLYRLVELSTASARVESEKWERAARTVREIVEKYIGLTMAAAATEPDAPPSGREMELFRVSGRRDEDLLLAGRCLRRRNTARLILHQARARTELLHALAEISEIAGARNTSLDVRAARHLSVELLRFYACAFDLLSLLEDESAARGVAHLLDRECARLRRLEAIGRKESKTTEEESCTTQAPQTAFASPSPTRALTQS